jgi:ribose transport system permease protein/putative xylitol transport system permease protein
VSSVEERKPAEAPAEGAPGVGERGALLRRRRLLAQKYLSLVYPLVTIVGLIIYFGIENDRFLTTSNAVNISRQAAVLLMFALAGTMVILIGGIDLSVGANATLAGIVLSRFIDDTGLVGGVLIALAVGAAAGAVNGAVHTALRVPSFLVTLGMLSVLNGVSNHLSHGQPVIFLDTSLGGFVNATLIGGIPNVAVISIGVLALLTLVGFWTRLGRYLYAIGGGERAARLAGVPLARYKILAFALAGALAGFAGVQLTGQVGSGTPLAGDPFLLDSIAAVVVGGTALSGGVGGFHRTLLGVLVISILSTGMNITDVHPYTQLIVKGIVVIVAVALTIDRKKYAFIK